MEEIPAIEKAVTDFDENDIVGFIMQCVHGIVSDNARTLKGEFPGDKTRAMGHALEVVTMAAEHDIDAKREYITKMNDYDLHRIHIHIEKD